MSKSDSLKYAVNNARLAGSKTYQYRVRVNAHRFVHVLRSERMGVKHWDNITNKHFQRVADALKMQGVGDGRIAEIFSAARKMCSSYGNFTISESNSVFGVVRGSIANYVTKAIELSFISNIIERLEAVDQYVHAKRCAAQIRLQHELGLRREEAAKIDLVNDWNKERNTLLIRNGTKGGRPRLLTDLSKQQVDALEKALPFVERSNRKGCYNLMPAGIGDRWQNCLGYVARKYGLTKKDSGFTLHGNRHERFRKMYLQATGFEPPNRFPSVAEYRQNAYAVAGERWSTLDADARDSIEEVAGHSKGRRDISNAYLGSSK